LNDTITSINTTAKANKILYGENIDFLTSCLRLGYDSLSSKVGALSNDISSLGSSNC